MEDSCGPDTNGNSVKNNNKTEVDQITELSENFTKTLLESEENLQQERQSNTEDTTGGE